MAAMTDEQINDCFTALGRAFAERRDLNKRTADLKAEIGRTAEALRMLATGSLSDHALRTLDEANDPRETVREYRAALLRLEELDKILAD